MSAHELVIGALVVLGVGSELLCCVGLVVMRDVYDRLHYAIASATVPPFLVAAAVLVEEGWTQPGINAVLIAIVMLVGGGTAGHAIARTARSRR